MHVTNACGERTTAAALLSVLSGDLDNDGAVTTSDLAILLAHFGSTAATGSDGDSDLDGDVDLRDLTAFLASFGMACD